MKFWVIAVFVVIGLVGLVIFTSPTKHSTTPQAGDLASMIGKPAPSFILQSYNGATTSLSKLRGKDMILFFNEGITCYPACWNQIAALGSDNNLNNSHVTTASIVGNDSASEWISAVHQMPELGKETILLDPGNIVATKYGTLNLPSSMHPGEKSGHTYVIVDQNGIVRYVHDDPNMGVDNTLLEKELEEL